MSSNDPIAEHPTHVNPYAAADVLAILRENHWLNADPTPEQAARSVSSQSESAG